MDKNCSIARDLMPQVIDHIASEASTAFVTDHTAGCEPCAQVFDDMRADIQGAQTQGGNEESPSFRNAISQLKKTMNWKRILIVAVTAIVTAFIVYTVYFLLFVQNGHPLPNKDYELHLFQSENGTVYVIPKFLKSLNSSGVSSSFDTDTGVITIHWTSTLIPGGHDIEPRWYPHPILKLTLTNDQTLLYGTDSIVKELRRGTKDNYIVLYKAGDAIPMLPPAMATYIQQEELFFSQMDAVDAAMDEARQMGFDAHSVYQEYVDQWNKEQAIEPTATIAP